MELPEKNWGDKEAYVQNYREQLELQRQADRTKQFVRRTLFPCEASQGSQGSDTSTLPLDPFPDELKEELKRREKMLAAVETPQRQPAKPPAPNETEALGEMATETVKTEVKPEDVKETEVVDTKPKEQDAEVLDKKPQETEVVDTKPKEQDAEVLDKKPQETEVVDTKPKETETSVVPVVGDGEKQTEGVDAKPKETEATVVPGVGDGKNKEEQKDEQAQAPVLPPKENVQDAAPQDQDGNQSQKGNTAKGSGALNVSVLSGVRPLSDSE